MENVGVVFELPKCRASYWMKAFDVSTEQEKKIGQC